MRLHIWSLLALITICWLYRVLKHSQLVVLIQLSLASMLLLQNESFQWQIGMPLTLFTFLIFDRHHMKQYPSWLIFSQCLKLDNKILLSAVTADFPPIKSRKLNIWDKISPVFEFVTQIWGSVWSSLRIVI